MTFHTCVVHTFIIFTPLSSSASTYWSISSSHLLLVYLLFFLPSSFCTTFFLYSLLPLSLLFFLCPILFFRVNNKVQSNNYFLENWTPHQWLLHMKKWLFLPHWPLYIDIQGEMRLSGHLLLATIISWIISGKRMDARALLLKSMTAPIF